MKRSLVLRAFLVLVVLSATAVVTPTGVDAQVSPADSAAVLLQAADGFAREGRWEVAEAIYERITERFGGTPAAATAQERLSASADSPPQRTSRVELQVFGTTYGAWLGVAVPLALDADDAEAFGAGLLLGAPVGLLLSRAYMRANTVSEGQARAISWGGTWGTWQGFGWAELLDIGEGEICDDFGCSPTDDNGQEIVTSMVVGGLAGIVGGGLLARNPIESGISSGAQGGSIWGSIYGAMLAGLFVPDSEDTVLATALISGNVGLVAGALLADRYDLSRSRIRMMNLGALVGGLGGVGLDLLIQPDEEEIVIAIPLATSVLGLGIAAARTADASGGSDDQVPDLNRALLGYSEGRLSLRPPLPVPTMRALYRPGAPTEWAPALSVELFRATF